MRIFLDANILFSAAKTDGAIRHLLRLVLEAGHQCWIDDYVEVEARRNLIAKDGDAVAVLDALLARLHIGAAQAPAAARKDLDWLPEKDRPVLAAAIRLQCDVLLTGDRSHFGAGYGKVFGGVTIHSPRSLFLSLVNT